ncbi:MAG: phasin family protein [Gammaproteobacteria bacterium]|nr:phasin family protein [Gammaproteobacteria bacterium]MCP5197993.1 phasin family protein [Gammaproteobacteria bacterium]
MVKKVTVSVDSQEPRSIQESAHLIWLAGLGAFAKVSQEGGKVFEALIKEGEEIERRNRRAAVGQMEAMHAKTDEARNKMTGAWDRVEQIFENRLARVLGQLGVPNHDDLRELTQRVESLQAHIDELSRLQEGQQPK